MEAPGEVHLEDRDLVEKLAKLQDMHQQIQDLRGLLPDKLLRPAQLALASPRNVTPEKVALDLKKTAVNGSRDIQRFKKDFHSPEMRDTWQKTSSAEFAQGRDSWTVDYQQLVRKPEMNSVTPNAQANGDSRGATESNEDVGKVVERSKETNPSVQIEFAQQPNALPLNVKIDRTTFQVTGQTQDEKNLLHVGRLPDARQSELQDNIMQFINDHWASAGLETLLSLLASYRDLEFRHCDKCQNVFDDKMTVPYVRRRNPSTDKDNKGSEWLAMHRDCDV